MLALLGLASLIAQPASRLDRARVLLTGEHKDTKAAEQLLREIVQGRAGEANAQTLAYAYVYLGYIEDRAGHRQQAVDWFRKAVDLAGAPPGILVVARDGLKRPVVRIPHLDDPGTRGPARPVLATPPPEITPIARNLSDKARRENFEALWNAIDANYACFGLKSIDWPAIGRRYRSRLDTIRDDDDFYELLFQLVNELRALPRREWGPPGSESAAASTGGCKRPRSTPHSNRACSRRRLSSPSTFPTGMEWWFSCRNGLARGQRCYFVRTACCTSPAGR